MSILLHLGVSSQQAREVRKSLSTKVYKIVGKKKSAT